MPGITLEQYDGLIGDIYSAGLDSEKWVDFLDNLNRALDGMYLCLHGHDLRNNFNMGILYSKYEDAQMDAFKAYYAPLNPWIPGLASIPVGAARTSESFLPLEELFKSEFYNDWIRPQEDIATGGGMVLFREDDRMFALSGNIRLKDREATQDTLIQTLELLGPHLQRALNIQRLIGTHQLSDRRYREVLDELDKAVFLLNRQGKVSHANIAGEQLVRQRELLYMDGAKILRAYDPDGDKLIAQGIGTIGEVIHHQGGGPIALRTRSGGHMRMATLVPFRLDPDDSGILSDFAFADLPVAMLTVADPMQKRDPARHALVTLYGLTPAELDLAEALFEGGTLKTFAERRGVSIHTVRVQLKSAFHKTGTNKQSELVGLVARLGGA